MKRAYNPNYASADNTGNSTHKLLWCCRKPEAGLAYPEPMWQVGAASAHRTASTKQKVRESSQAGASFSVRARRTTHTANSGVTVPLHRTVQPSALLALTNFAVEAYHPRRFIHGQRLPSLALRCSLESLAKFRLVDCGSDLASECERRELGCQFSLGWEHLSRCRVLGLELGLGVLGQPQSYFLSYLFLSISFYFLFVLDCSAMAAAAMANMRVQQACSCAKAVTDELPNALPPAFLAFLKQNDLDASIYAAAATLPRYIRVKLQASSEIPEIEEELGLKLSPLTWLPNFFSLPPEAQIASTQAYQQGKLYGMDAASGAAVAALEISSGDHVLDLCAAPGAKLCMMAEFLGDSGSLTAVDIARPRLAACRTMLRKYGLGRRTRLYLGDGTSFSLLPLTGASKLCPANASDDQCHDEESRGATGNSDRHNEGGFQKSARMETTTLYGEWRSGRTRQEKRAAKRAKYLGIPLQIGEDGVSELFFYGVNSGVVGMKVADVAQTCSDSPNVSLGGYDKVLVDAECTHDGSLKHITKYEQWGWETFERRFLNEDRIASITSLQLRLLSNGFRLLNPGGILVYSTCSFTKDQNEGVVERFLATHDAELQEVELARQWPCRPGGLPHTLRFDPVASNTSGLFMAKITKLGPGLLSKPGVGGSC